MISFIIPAHNESALIAATLGALQVARSALVSPSEVIVVDDASTDDTAAIAAAHGARVLRVEHRHIAATRNAGARAALGELLIFVDADTTVGADVVRAAVAAIESGAIGGGCTVRLQAPTRWHERAAAAWFVWLLRLSRIAPGCFLFCTRSAFDAVGGFDPTWFAAEDVAISRALRRHGRFVILREAVHTSGRKLQTFSIAEHLRLMLKIATHGKRVLKSRDALDLWYSDRR
ncbi:MAG: glycosyltransferase [Dokdonella sp.]